PLTAESRFCLIASNPPYIGENEIETLSPSVIQHEPRQALIAGKTGTEVIDRLIPEASERLLAGCWLVLAVSPLIASQVSERIAATAQFDAPITIKDLAGLARVLKARRIG